MRGETLLTVLYCGIEQNGGICIVEYTQEEYSKFYIVQALFRLMSEYDYEKISITDITKKAGVGRVTFYRHFKRKEDVLIYYFEHSKKRFEFSRRIYPRCRQDYVKVVTEVLNLFKENKEPLKSIKRARLEYLYLDYLNKRFSETFKKDYPGKSAYTPFIYSGMLFNVSMAWLENDCKEEVSDIAETIVSALFDR